MAAFGCSLRLIRSYRLDADFSASYACCTQEVLAAFQHQFWVKFFVGAVAAIVGCLAVSVLFSRRTAMVVGLLAISAGVAVMFLVLPTTNVEGWTGASALVLIGVLFVTGVASLLVGTVRIGWAALCRHRV